MTRLVYHAIFFSSRIIHWLTSTGFEPVLPPWKGDVLTAWPWGRLSQILNIKNSPSRARTYNNSVNSRVLYHWAIEEYYKGLYLQNFIQILDFLSSLIPTYSLRKTLRSTTLRFVSLDLLRKSLSESPIIFADKSARCFPIHPSFSPLFLD